MQILLVDDSKLSRLQTKLQLDTLQGDFKFNTESVEDGAQAVRKCLGKFYDIVIMDVEMPVLNGYDACAQIKLIAPSTRVVLLTTWATSENFKQGKQAGCNHYLLKPVNVKDLRSILRIVSGNKENKL